jgi:mannosyl-oligosaccharide alpha-1,2-mannosidase
MGMKEEFERAVNALDQIDFTTCSLEELNVFETTIRYLGGFLSAFDLSDGKYPSLLMKAVEMGDMLYVAFDTPNRMPITRWNFKAAFIGARQTAPEAILLAELGSLTLEFTRLSQLSGNPKYYDAVQRIMDVFDEQQAATKLPGMWPIVVNARDLNMTEASLFTIGGMADSTYEYLPKVISARALLKRRG